MPTVGEVCRASNIVGRLLVMILVYDKKIVATAWRRWGANRSEGRCYDVGVARGIVQVSDS